MSISPSEHVAFRRDTLLQIERELLATFSDRSDIAVDSGVADELERTLSMAQREQATVARNKVMKRLRQVQHALDRIQHDEGGECEDCELEISATRLRAVPEATRCVECQSRRER